MLRSAPRWRIPAALCPLLLLAAFATGCASQTAGGGGAAEASGFEFDEDYRPGATLRPAAGPASFEFAIVGDRTGGHRPGVFEAVIERLGRLRPEFVVSVGDLIEGYSEDRDELAAMWAEIDRETSRLGLPFFSVPGNHDVGNEVMRELWRERNGCDYYHFVYRDVLFVMLNTEDPPVQLPEKLLAQIAYFKKLLAEDPAKAQALVRDNREAREEIHLPVSISDRQVEYVRRLLEEHRDVRWTFFILHKPAWEYEAANFERIEALAADRPYSMFAGHHHNYRRVVRDGHDYIRLGTAGGVWHHEGAGNMDHITWVSVTDRGPVVTNLLLDGLLDERGPSAQGGQGDSGAD